MASRSECNLLSYHFTAIKFTGFGLEIERLTLICSSNQQHTELKETMVALQLHGGYCTASTQPSWESLTIGHYRYTGKPLNSLEAFFKWRTAGYTRKKKTWHFKSCINKCSYKRKRHTRVIQTYALYFIPCGPDWEEIRTQI